MRSIRMACCILLLGFNPVAAHAQAGVTPLLAGPLDTGRGSEFGGYISIEEEIDFFGLYRFAAGPRTAVGLRAGYTDLAGGGLHIGGDARYGLRHSNPDLPLQFALAGGVQFTFADAGNLLAIPFGIAIGADVGEGARPVILYGLPHLLIERFDPDGPFDSDTEVEFGVDLGGEVLVSRRLWGIGVLTIASNDNDNVALALGLTYR